MAARFNSLIFLILAGALFAVALRNSDGIGCSNPFIFKARVCHEWEEQILNSTVRILIESWTVLPGDKGYDIQYSMGHATVMNGRFLVTHNHYDLPFSIRTGEIDERSYRVIYLFNARGVQVFKCPLSDFSIVSEHNETLILAYKQEAIFEKLGFASAEFASWPSFPLEVGAEVAQIDWDGQSTRVDWTRVEEIHAGDGVTKLLLSDGILPGASGGGIFRQGVHIGNNWELHETLGANGVVKESSSTGALNLTSLLDYQERPSGH